eukprot:627755-Amphidinium_carterae.2
MVPCAGGPISELIGSATNVVRHCALCRCVGIDSLCFFRGDWGQYGKPQQHVVVGAAFPLVGCGCGSQCLGDFFCSSTKECALSSQDEASSAHSFEIQAMRVL